MSDRPPALQELVFDVESARVAGRTHGYPECCIEAFVIEVERWFADDCPMPPPWSGRAKDGYVRCADCWKGEE